MMTFEPLDVYCSACSAGVGTPCNNPFTGADTDFHAPRIRLAENASDGVFRPGLILW